MGKQFFFVIVCTFIFVHWQCLTCVRGDDGTHSECDNDNKVPYRVEVSHDGKVTINCRYVDCVNASKEKPVCEKKYHGRPCNHGSEWVHGVKRSGVFQSTCCSYERLKYASFLGTTVVHRGQAFLGGFSFWQREDLHGNQGGRNGFDVISNITKVKSGYQIWVHRLQCIPPAKEQINQKNPDYYDSKGHTGGNPSLDYAQVQTRDSEGNVQSVPVVYSGGCFDDQTIVSSKERGPVAVSELRVGEEVLTVHSNVLVYRKVSFFLHKDRTKRARFLTLHTEQAGASVTMTPLHIIFGGDCHLDPYENAYPQKFAEEVRVGHCLLTVDKETGRMERVRVTNITETYKLGVYSPVTTNGVIVTNDLVSSCYSFVKNPDVQVTVFYYMAKIEQFFQTYFSTPVGWLLGNTARLDTVEIPPALATVLSIVDKIFPLSNFVRL